MRERMEGFRVGEVEDEKESEFQPTQTKTKMKKRSESLLGGFSSFGQVKKVAVSLSLALFPPPS